MSQFSCTNCSIKNISLPNKKIIVQPINSTNFIAIKSTNSAYTPNSLETIVTTYILPEQYDEIVASVYNGEGNEKNSYLEQTYFDESYSIPQNVNNTSLYVGFNGIVVESIDSSYFECVGCSFSLEPSFNNYNQIEGMFVHLNIYNSTSIFEGSNIFLQSIKGKSFVKMPSVQIKKQNQAVKLSLQGNLPASNSATFLVENFLESSLNAESIKTDNCFVVLDSIHKISNTSFLFTVKPSDSSQISTVQILEHAFKQGSSQSKESNIVRVDWIDSNDQFLIPMSTTIETKGSLVNYYNFQGENPEEFIMEVVLEQNEFFINQTLVFNNTISAEFDLCQLNIPASITGNTLTIKRSITDNLGGSFTTTKNLPLEIGGTNSRVLKVNNVQCFEKNIKIVNPLFGEGTVKNNSLMNSSFNFEHTLPIGSSIKVFYDLSENKTLKIFNNNDFQCTGCIHTVDGVIENGETTGLYITIVPALNTNSSGQLIYQGDEITLSDGNTLIFSAAKIIWRNYGVKISLINEQSLNSFAEIKIESSFLNTESSLLTGDTSNLLLNNASFLSANSLGSKDFIILVVPEDPLQPSFVQIKEGLYVNTSLRSSFSNVLSLTWPNNYSGITGTQLQTESILTGSTISFKDTLSEESNHQQIPITNQTVEVNFKNGNVSTLVYSQNTNDSIDLCTLGISNQATGNYLIEIKRSITNASGSVSPMHTIEYDIFLDGTTSKILYVNGVECYSEKLVVASSYIGTSFYRDSYLKNPSTRQDTPSGSSVTIFYDFQGNHIHFLQSNQLNNIFTCTGCTYMQTHYIDSDNYISGLFVTVSPYTNGNTAGMLSLNNGTVIKSSSDIKLLFPKIDVIWSDQAVKVFTLDEYPLKNITNVIVEKNLLSGPLEMKDIFCDNCAVRNITQSNFSQYTLQVSPLDISRSSGISINRGAFKSGTQKSFASNLLQLSWDLNYQGPIGSDPYSEILLTKGYFSSKDTQGETGTNNVESLSGNYEVLTSTGNIMAQNTSGIDLCRELNLGVLSSGSALQNIKLRRNLIQQGISYVFDQAVTLLIGDTPLRVLSVDNYTCLEESNLVITGKIHGGSLNPINYHNREIMIPNGENITIYYDFNGLEISSLPLIVPSDFNCTNCSVVNISNYSTSGDTQGIFVTVKPNTINTAQATLTLVSNLLSTSGVKIYFKPSIINYSNQAVYLSHDDINPLTQEQVVRVSSKFLTTDVTVQDIRNNLSMNNCTFLNHHFVNNDVFLTFIPQYISRESSIQLNKGFFKNSLNELSFASNMLFFNWDAAYAGSIGSVSIPEIEQKDGKIFFNNISRETASNTELEFSSIETKILEGNNVITIINGNEPIDLCNLILPNNTNPGMHQLTIERKLIDSLGSSSSFMNIYINVTTNPLRVSQVDNFTCSIPQKVSASVSFGDGIFKDSYHKSSLETIFNLPLGLEGIVYYDFNGKSVNNITSNHFSCSGCDIVSMNPSLNSSNEIEGVFVKVKQLGLLPINGTLEGASSLNLKSIDQNTIILPPQKIHWSDRGVKISLMNSLYPIVDYANILVTSSMPILNINDLTKIINNNAAIDSIIPNGLNEYIIKVVPNRSNEESYIQIEDAYMGNIIGSYSSNQITLQWGDPYTTQNTILPKGYLFIRNNNQEALLDYTVVGGETSNGPAIIPNISSTTTLEIGPSIIYSNTSNDQYLDLCLTNVNTSSRGIQNIIAKKIFMDSSNQINQLTYNFTAFISDGPDASFSGIITQVGAFNCPKIIKKSPVITSFTRGTSGVNLSVLSFVEVRGAFNGQTCSLWGNRTIDLINGVNSILPAPYNQSFANATTTYSICKLATTLAIGTYSTISAVRTINDCGGSISATIPNITITVGNVAGVNRITNVNTFVCP